MLKSVIGAVFGTRHERERRKIQPVVDEINAEYARLHDVSEEELRGQTAKLRGIIRERTQRARGRRSPSCASASAWPPTRWSASGSTRS